MSATVPTPLAAKIARYRKLKLSAAQNRHLFSRAESVFGAPLRHPSNGRSVLRGSPFQNSGGAKRKPQAVGWDEKATLITRAEGPCSYRSYLRVPLHASVSLHTGSQSAPSAAEAEERAVGSALSIFPSTQAWQHMLEVGDSHLFRDLTKTASVIDAQLAVHVSLAERGSGGPSSVARRPSSHSPTLLGSQMLPEVDTPYVVTITAVLPSSFDDEYRTGVTRVPSAQSGSTVALPTEEDCVEVGRPAADVALGRHVAASPRDALKLAMTTAIEALHEEVIREWKQRDKEARLYLSTVLGGCDGARSRVDAHGDRDCSALLSFLRCGTLRSPVKPPNACERLSAAVPTSSSSSCVSRAGLRGQVLLPFSGDSPEHPTERVVAVSVNSHDVPHSSSAAPSVERAWVCLVPPLPTLRQRVPFLIDDGDHHPTLSFELNGALHWPDDTYTATAMNAVAAKVRRWQQHTEDSLRGSCRGSGGDTVSVAQALFWVEVLLQRAWRRVHLGRVTPTAGGVAPPKTSLRAASHVLPTIGYTVSDEDPSQPCGVVALSAALASLQLRVFPDPTVIALAPCSGAPPTTPLPENATTEEGELKGGRGKTTMTPHTEFTRVRSERRCGSREPGKPLATAATSLSVEEVCRPPRSPAVDGGQIGGSSASRVGRPPLGTASFTRRHPGATLAVSQKAAHTPPAALLQRHLLKLAARAAETLAASIAVSSDSDGAHHGVRHSADFYGPLDTVHHALHEVHYAAVAHDAGTVVPSSLRGETVYVCESGDAQPTVRPLCSLTEQVLTSTVTELFSPEAELTWSAAQSGLPTTSSVSVAHLTPALQVGLRWPSRVLHDTHTPLLQTAAHVVLSEVTCITAKAVNSVSSSSSVDLATQRERALHTVLTQRPSVDGGASIGASLARQLQREGRRRREAQDSLLCPDVLQMIQEMRVMLELPQSAFPVVEFTQEAKHDPERRSAQIRAGAFGDVDVKTRVVARWGGGGGRGSLIAVAESNPAQHAADCNGVSPARAVSNMASERGVAVPGIRSPRAALSEANSALLSSSSASSLAARYPWLTLCDTGDQRGPLLLLLAAVCALYERVCPGRAVPLLPVRTSHLTQSPRHALDFLLHVWFAATPQIRCFEIFARPHQQQQVQYPLPPPQTRRRSHAASLGSATVVPVPAVQWPSPTYLPPEPMIRAMLFYDLLGQRVLFAETHASTVNAAVAQVEALAVRYNLPPTDVWRPRKPLHRAWRSTARASREQQRRQQLHRMLLLPPQPLPLGTEKKDDQSGVAPASTVTSSHSEEVAHRRGQLRRVLRSYQSELAALLALIDCLSNLRCAHPSEDSAGATVGDTPRLPSTAAVHLRLPHHIGESANKEGMRSEEEEVEDAVTSSAPSIPGESSQPSPSPSRHHRGHGARCHLVLRFVPDEPSGPHSVRAMLSTSPSSAAPSGVWDGPGHEGGPRHQIHASARELRGVAELRVQRTCSAFPLQPKRADTTDNNGALSALMAAAYRHAKNTMSEDERNGQVGRHAAAEEEEDRGLCVRIRVDTTRPSCTAGVGDGRRLPHGGPLHTTCTTDDSGDGVGLLPAYLQLCRALLHQLTGTSSQQGVQRRVEGDRASDDATTRTTATVRQCLAQLNVTVEDLLMWCADADPVLCRDGYPPFSPRFYHAPNVLGEVLQGIAAKYYCAYEYVQPSPAPLPQLCSGSKSEHARDAPTQLYSALPLHVSTGVAAGSLTQQQSGLLPNGGHHDHRCGDQASGVEEGGSSVTDVHVRCVLYIPAIVSYGNIGGSGGCSAGPPFRAEGGDATMPPLPSSYSGDGFVLAVGVGGTKAAAWRDAAWRALRLNFPRVVRQVEALRTLSELQRDPVRLWQLGAPYGLRWDVRVLNEASSTSSLVRATARPPLLGMGGDGEHGKASRRCGEVAEAWPADDTQWAVKAVGGAAAFTDESAAALVPRSAMEGSPHALHPSSSSASRLPQRTLVTAEVVKEDRAAAVEPPSVDAHGDKASRRGAHFNRSDVRVVVVEARSGRADDAFVLAVEELTTRLRVTRRQHPTTTTTTIPHSLPIPSPTVAMSAGSVSAPFSQWDSTGNYSKSVWHACCGALGVLFRGRVRLCFAPGQTERAARSFPVSSHEGRSDVVPSRATTQPAPTPPPHTHQRGERAGEGEDVGMVLLLRQWERDRAGRQRVVQRPLLRLPPHAWLTASLVEGGRGDHRGERARVPHDATTTSTASHLSHHPQHTATSRTRRQAAPAAGASHLLHDITLTLLGMVRAGSADDSSHTAPHANATSSVHVKASSTRDVVRELNTLLQLMLYDLQSTAPPAHQQKRPGHSHAPSHSASRSSPLRQATALLERFTGCRVECTVVDAASEHARELPTSFSPPRSSSYGYVGVALAWLPREERQAADGEGEPAGGSVFSTSPSSASSLQQRSPRWLPVVVARTEVQPTKDSAARSLLREVRHATCSRATQQLILSELRVGG